MKPTMQDVADLAQVSRATVSRVLADSANVSQDKRAIVLAAVQKLGYKPHKKFRNQHRLFICISPTQKTDPFSHDIIKGIKTGIHTFRAKHDIEFLGEEQASADQRLPASILDPLGQADGLVILGILPLTEQQLLLHDRKIPAVIIHGVGSSEVFSYIGIDERRAMLEIVSELAQLGHKRIGYIHGPEDCLDHQERLRAFKLGLLSSRLPVDSSLVVFSSDWDQESGYKAASALLTTAAPSAIITANDQLALGVYRAAEELGWKIPEELSVVGFGDLACAQHAQPPLSTISVPLESIGKWAVALVCANIADSDFSPVRLTVPASYRRRNSVAGVNYTP